MLRVCKICNKIHHHDYKCKKKVASRNTTELQRKENKFYTSYEWIKLSNLKKKDVLYQCEVCKLFRVVPNYSNEVHHLTEVREDWSKRLEWDNLLAVCSSCHHSLIHKNKLKSFKEIKKFVEENKENLI